MEIVLYNDGAGGRSRLVLQLAGVHTESRYGITPIPNLTGTPGSTSQAAPTPPPADIAPLPPAAPAGQSSSAVPATEPVTHVLPNGTRVVTITPKRASISHPVLPAPGRPLVERILRVPGEVLKEALHLIVENPAQLAMLEVWEA